MIKYFVILSVIFISITGHISGQSNSVEVVFNQSNIPIVMVTTINGASIEDGNKITANLKIIDNGEGKINKITDTVYDYNGYIGIEIRGSFSATLPQKPYSFETRDENGDNNNVKLLGLPKDNDWILLANYNDKSFVRNALAFHLFRKMGHYAPRTRHCEVVINGEYQGIYELTEKIKVNNKRVDIASLDEDDNQGDSLTGGYIFKVDYYDESTSFYSEYANQNGGDVFYVYHDPQYKNITSQQKSYLSDFVESFESVLYSDDYANSETGYVNYINVNSFIDYFIIGELSRNVDAYKKSAYFFKDKDSKGGLLNAGPVWDMDWAYKNFYDCHTGNLDGSGWAWRIHDCNPWPNPPKWMVRLMTDVNFTNSLNQRYFDLRKSILSENYLFNYIDSIATLLNDAQVRHYTKWPILGENVGTYEMDYVPNTFDGETAKFEKWISTRLNWLDDNWPEYRYVGIENQLVDNTYLCRIFPNPAKDLLYIASTDAINQIEIYSFSGQLVKVRTTNSHKYNKIDIADIPTGIYLLRMYTDYGNQLTGRVIKQ